MNRTNETRGERRHVEAREHSQLRDHPPRSMRRHWAIVPILMAFVVLGSIYKDATPVFETPGEPWHYAYVRRLADRRGLPRPKVSEDPWQQGKLHEPPLYYALGALLTTGIDIGAADAPYERNPYAALGDPHSSGNKNAVLHLVGEGSGLAGSDSPYRGDFQAVHRLRWFSIACSALTVFLTYCLAVGVAPRRRSIAAGAAALVALNPQFQFVSASANNDALAILLVTLALWLATHISRGKWRPYRGAIALGVSVGLASLTQLVGLVSVILIPCAFWGRWRRTWSEMQSKPLPKEEQAREDLVRPVLLALAVAGAIGGWWYARNAILYRDAPGIRAVLAALDTGQTRLPLQKVLSLLWEASCSYWGLFGWMNIPAPDAFYALVRIMSALGAIGTLLALAWVYWRRGRLTLQRQRPGLPLASWVLTMVAWLAWWTRMTGKPQGQLLFPAISGISLLLSMGFTAWLPRCYSDTIVFCLSALLLALSLMMPYRCITPSYEPPKRIALEEVPADIHDLNVSFGDALFLLGYELLQDGVKAGDPLRLRLYWLGRKLMHEDYAFHLYVLGRQGSRIGRLDTYPGLGSYPTRLWLPGDVLCDDYAIAIDESAMGPTAGSVRVGVSSGPGTEMLPAVDAQGVPIGQDCPITQVRVAPAEEVLYEPQTHLQVNLGRKAMLTGYALVPKTPSAGDNWEINLYWQPLVRMSKDYTVFVHLVNDAGELVAQVDEQPIGGDYPTHLWELEEQIKDTHVLSLPIDLPPGKYSLQVGLYLLDAGERLPVVDTDQPATSVTLGPVPILAR